ncbi:hypothetical protein HK100_006011 [Physocladia obscura]|uniref:Exocyst complex component Sec3 coiled-coil domain-containing protein n=1 Tax=Physocladia obscura TaxID=109957 RepID=A0AAD5SQY5_9FUNG|nr:hypothetical protein HK100_006011 [Physocladia obscura]
MAISLVSKNSSSSASQTAKTSVEQKKQPVPLTIPNATSAPTATQESAKFSHIASNIPESNFQLHVSTTVAHTPTDNDLEAFLEKEISNQEKRNIKEQQSFNLNELLGGFNWQVNGDAADLEKKLESELQALEAANVHAIIESEESAEKVLNQIQSTLNELKTIDEWLFHYTTLLDRMGQDVHSVEVRNKVLQVTTANQKSLLNEVDKIVTSMKLSEPVSQRLKYESLDEISGIKSCERAIQVLTETIGRVKKDEDIADIVMVKERIGLYDSYSTQFGERLTEFLKQLFANLVETLAKEKQPRTSKILLKISGLDNSQRKLCQYRPLMKWLKSIDTRKHKDLEMHYIDAFGRFYKKEIREYIDSMKTIHCKRKTTTEDLDYIFSAPQVSVSSAATTALSTMSSNMIERGKGGWNMLGGTAAAAIGSRKKGIVEEDFEKSEVVVVKGASVSEDSKIWPDEAIIEIYKSLCPIIVCELNFVMDFFNIRKNLSEDTADSEISHDWIDSLKTPREKLKDMKPQKTLK